MCKVVFFHNIPCARSHPTPLWGPLEPQTVHYSYRQSRKTLLAVPDFREISWVFSRTDLPQVTNFAPKYPLANERIDDRFRVSSIARGYSHQRTGAARLARRGDD